MLFARFSAMSLLCGTTWLTSAAVAQQTGPFTSLADLRKNAARFANRTVTVRSHFSQGNGTPVIFDNDRTTVLPIQWSNQIRDTPQYRELIKATEKDWLVFTGHLDGGINFVIHDGQFDNTPHVTIKVINARTDKPVTDERLNVALREDQIGSVALPTDTDGIIDVTTGNATIIRILSNMYGDCRSRGELYTNYSIAEIHQNGITTGNLCSNARPQAKPGELILYEIPKTFIPSYPKPPLPSTPPVPVSPESFLAPAPYTISSEVKCSTPS